MWDNNKMCVFQMIISLSIYLAQKLCAGIYIFSKHLPTSVSPLHQLQHAFNISNVFLAILQNTLHQSVEQLHLPRCLEVAAVY